MYQNGEGVTRDLSRAVQWYAKAIQNHDPDARENLEYIATQLDDANAQYHMACFYERGRYKPT